MDRRAALGAMAGGVLGALAMHPGSAAGATPAQDDHAEQRHIVYSLSRQQVWLVRNNLEVLRTYPVSGRLDIPKPGRYAVYSRSERARSSISIGVEWNWMIRFAYSPNGWPIGFHEIPERKVNGKWKSLQTEAQLGIKRSSGCVRQSGDNARFLWSWAPVGTPVIVMS